MRLQKLLEPDLEDEPARIAEEDFISFGGQSMPNPVTLLSHPNIWKKFPEYRAIMAPLGNIHGDLYSKNILGINQENALPQIIDFADHAASQLIFYDYLYLEFDLLCRILPPDEYAARASLLKLVEFLTEEDIALQRDPSGGIEATGLVDLVRPLRQSALRHLHDEASVDHKIAFFTAGVAVGLNFARKSTVDSLTQRLGLLYAGAMFRRIMKQFDIDHAIDRPLQIFWLELEKELAAIQQRHFEENEARASQRVIDIRPHVIPDYLYNRIQEYQDTITHLDNPAVRLITIFEQHGTGKTALVSRVLQDLLGKSVRAGCYDNAPPPEVKDVIYLSPKQAGDTFTLKHIFRTVAERFGEEAQKNLLDILESEADIAEKTSQLHAYFADGLYVLWIDDFEELLCATGEFRDGDIGAFVREVGRLNESGLRLIITSRQSIESDYLEAIPTQRKRPVPFKRMPLANAKEMMKTLGPALQNAEPD